MVQQHILRNIWIILMGYWRGSTYNVLLLTATSTGEKVSKKTLWHWRSHRNSILGKYIWKDLISKHQYFQVLALTPQILRMPGGMLIWHLNMWYPQCGSTTGYTVKTDCTTLKYGSAVTTVKTYNRMASATFIRNRLQILTANFFTVTLTCQEGMSEFYCYILV